MNKLLCGIAAVGTCMIFRKLYWNFYRSYFKLPPGPVGYPLIGSLPNLYLNTEKYLNYVAAYYGDISSVFVGYNNLIIISNSSLMRQIWTNKNFIHRPFKSVKDLHVKRKIRPFPFINGDEWKLRRKNFSTSIITMLESSKINIIINRVLNETIFPEIDNRIMHHNHIGIVINDICHLAVFNTLYFAAFGSQIPMNDDNYIKIKEWIETIFAEKNSFDPGRFNKTFRHLRGTFDAKYKRQTDKVYKAIKNKHDLFYQLIKTKLSTMDDLDKNIKHTPSASLVKLSETEESKEDESTLCIVDDDKEKKDNKSSDEDEKGFVDIMLEEQRKNNDKISFEMIIDDIGTVFTAGTDTTSSAIELCIYCLIIYHHLQQQIYHELFKCIQNAQSNDNNNNNNNKYFDLKLQVKCPVFRAFIHESMRLHGIGVISPARSCIKDTFIDHKEKEYLIPRNSIIVASQVGLCSNNVKSNIDVWGKDVNEFNVNRWLVNDKFQYNHNFPIFSFGRRDCPGRSLAMKDIILIVSNLILNYKFGAFNNDIEKFKNDFKKNKRSYSVYRFDPALRLSVAKRYR